MGQGRIIGLAAVLGLLAVFGVFLALQFHLIGEAPRPVQGDYDLVFKYCIQHIKPDDLNPSAELRADPLYNRIDALKPGEYKAGDGKLYLMGGGMFQIALPLQLQVVRNMGGNVKASSSTDQPHSIIGCTTGQAVRALEAYGLTPDLPPAAVKTK
jgi:hypothetical protein